MKKLSLLFLALLTFWLPMAKAQQTLTVADGTTTNSYIPFYGYNADVTQQSQIIYPADLLTDMVGKDITKMVFYTQTSDDQDYGGDWKLKLGICEAAAFPQNNYDQTTTLTQVFQGTFSRVDATKTVTITFDDPFNYTGGNLLFDLRNYQSGNWSSTAFFGISSTGASISSATGNNNNSGTSRNWLPKTTFTYETPATCPKPTGLTASDITAESATLSWTSEASSFKVRYKVAGGDSWTEKNASTTSLAINGLAPAKKHDFQVKALCGGSDESDWSAEGHFTTACPSYYSAPYTENFESYTVNTIAPCWDNSISTTTTATGTPYYVWGVYSYNNNKMIRMYNSLVQSGVAAINMPDIELPANEYYELSFDYSHRANINTFAVKISTDGGANFTNLKSYNASGITHSSDPGTFVTAEPISLSAYAGQTVTIQFYSYADYGSGAIFIDNISITEAPSCPKPTNVTVGTITYNTAAISWTSDADEFIVAYGKVNDLEQMATVNASTNSVTLTGLDPETTYYVYVKADCGTDGESEWSLIPCSFTTLVACPAPTGLTASNITKTGATISWNVGATGQDNFIVAYGEGTDPDQMSSVNPHTTTVDLNLSAGVTYNVYVKADCGGGYQSVWVGPCTFTTPLTDVLTVYGNGTTFIPTVPVYGLYCDDYLKCEYVMPATELEDMDGGQISSMTFYLQSKASASWGNARFRVFMKEVDFTTISAFQGYADATVVYQGPLDGTQSTMVVTFDEPYTYYGGNLLIGFYNEVKGTYKPASFYGETVSGACVQGYSGTSLDAVTPSTTPPNFLPKTTFGYTPAPPVACPKPKSLTYSDVTAFTATISWTSEASAFVVAYGTGTDPDLMTTTVNASTNSATLSGLEPETTYNVYVKAICSETDESNWSNACTFTTDVACHVPTAVTVSEITTTSATLTWTSDASNFVVAYGTGTDPEQMPTVNATTNSVTLNGLNSSTVYHAYVKAVCSAQYSSAWTSACTFATECDVFVIDGTHSLFQGFENGITCWTEISMNAANTTNGYYGVVEATPHSGTHSYEMNSYSSILEGESYDQYLISPELSSTSALEMTFWYRKNNNNYTDQLFVAYSTTTPEISAMSEWVEMSNISSTYQSASMTFPVGTKYIAFRYYGNYQYYLFIDDIDIHVALSCATPTDVTVSNINGPGATISWTSDADAFVVAYGTGTDPDEMATINVNTTTTNLNNLAANTTYNVFVKAVCGVGDESLWASASFSTTYSAPYTCGFEKTDFNGWYVRDADGDGNNWGRYHYSDYVHSGEYCMGSNSWANADLTPDNWLLSPAIYIPTGVTYYLSWYAKALDERWLDYYSVYVSTTGINSSDFDTEHPLYSDYVTGTYQRQTADLSAYAGQTIHLAFRHHNSEGIYYFFVDDVAITTLPNIFETEGDWGTASNWSLGTVPTASDAVVIQANATITNGEVATASTITLDGGSITIQDGGQLIHDNNGVYVTLKKTIEGYTGDYDNYYFVASPSAANVTPQNAGMLNENEDDDFDLYYFDQTQDAFEWQNYEAAAGFGISCGTGYLYANSLNANLNFTGEVYGSAEQLFMDASWINGHDFSGFNLIGNPFVCNVAVTSSDAANTLYYQINTNVDGEVIAVANPIVAPGTGLFASVASNGVKIYFDRSTNSANVTRGNDGLSLVNVELMQNEAVLDRAYLAPNACAPVKKLTLRSNSNVIYFEEAGRKLAKTYVNDSNIVPVYFDANKAGQYSLRVSLENMTCNYMHLIDNLTGANVNLLANPVYSFNAAPTDFSSRFKLVFSNKANGETENGNFAIMNGKHITIQEGEGRLNVIDVLGRVLLSTDVNGSFDTELNVAPGVYVLNLNGMTQKIVVR